MKSELDDIELPQLPPLKQKGITGVADWASIKISGVQPDDPGKHYRYQYKGINLDPFRIAQVYNINNMAQFTALKKILCTGKRGYKDLIVDIDDIICAMNRWKQMIHEDITDVNDNTN
jgi:hypothetical protein